MRRFAEDGANPHELMTRSGHRMLSEVQRYTDDADRERLADLVAGIPLLGLLPMALLVANFGTDN
jgi:hypothetical protein